MASGAVRSADMGQQMLGARVRELRDRLELRQQDVADHLGIPRSAVAMLEGGHRHLALEEAVLLADLLGVSLDTLAGRSTAQIDAYHHAYRRGWEAGHAAVADQLRDVLKATAGMSETLTRSSELFSGGHGA